MKFYQRLTSYIILPLQRKQGNIYDFIKYDRKRIVRVDYFR